MNRRKAVVVMTLGAALIVFAFASMMTADVRTGAVLPQMGMMRSGQNVTVVNPTSVAVATYGTALGYVTLAYGDKCYMFTGAPFVAIGLDGQRVLVRSRVQGPHQLYDEGAPVCAGDVLFWVGYQQYLLSADAYTKAQREKRAKENADERDRRTIRRLLDQQFTRK